MRSTSSRACAKRGSARSSIRPLPGLGRYIPRIREVAEAADLNIIVATGVYAFLELPNFLAYRSKEAIAELFVREIREGIDDTGVKAAFLKCAVERHGLVGDIPRIIEAIAMAAVETGAPVMVHTNAEQRTGLLALDALTRHGVDPGRIVIAHVGDSNDLDYIRRIAKAGAWIGCDRFGIDHFNPLADRIRTLTALVQEGLADRIHISHDAACFLDFFVGNPAFANEKPDYLLISNQVLPALLEAGVTQEQIDQIDGLEPGAVLRWRLGRRRGRSGRGTAGEQVIEHLAVVAEREGQVPLVSEQPRAGAGDVRGEPFAVG